MSTFDPSKIRKEIEEFTPRRPQRFQELMAAKDVIIELRRKRASYRSIADLLTRNCLPTCKTSVALFCHKILGESVRPYRRSTYERPSFSETPPSRETAPVKVVQSETPAPPNLNGSEPPPRSRGPRIAQVRMAKPLSQTT